MAKDPVLDLNKPRLFTKGVYKSTKESPGFVDFTKISDLGDTNFGSTASFRYDPPRGGIKSSQQLTNLDFSKFENHTFFNSAVAQVNVGFDRIINDFPFDGTRRNQEAFLDSLTGFEKWLFDRFPKNVGFLQFSGSQKTDGSGHYIKVLDSSGFEFGDFSNKKSAEKALDPKGSSFTIEMQIGLPKQANSDLVICQMLSKRADDNPNPDMGFTLGLTGSTSTGVADVRFFVTSASAILETSASIKKGVWTHIAASYDRTRNQNVLRFYVDGKEVNKSNTSFDMEEFQMGVTHFTIGSGSSQTVTGSTNGGIKVPTQLFTPKETLSGAIDEFRFWHSARTPNALEKYMIQNVYPDNNKLRLYYRFNEPADGTNNISNAVVDHSGYSLHTTVKNYTSECRLTGSDNTTGPLIIGGKPLVNPLKAELPSRNPVLFPNYRDVASLNSELISSGTEYDDSNPNLITRLVPQHYFIEGASFEGLPAEDTNVNREIGGSSIPGSGILYKPQILMAFLFTWAKHFDQIKMFIDHFSEIIHVDYDSGASDQFLLFASKFYGVDLPRIFNNVNVSQYAYGEELESNYVKAGLELKAIQNEIWRRITANIMEIIKSKGTIHSIKAMLRASGIEPDNIFRIREYGGIKRGTLEVKRVNRTEVSTMIDLTGSLALIDATTSLSPTGFLTGSAGSGGKPHIISPFLTGARLEVGFPWPKGTFVYKPKSGSVAGKHFRPETVSGRYGYHGISNNRSDGIFTSGSFTFEGIYNFPPLMTGSYDTHQSLMRLHVTGTAPITQNTGSRRPAQHGIMFNLIATSGSQKLTLFGRPCADNKSHHMELTLSGVDVFDGNKWNVSWGRVRADDPVLTASTRSTSSYFIMAGYSSYGEIRSFNVTSSFFDEASTGQKNYLEEYNATRNSHAPFIVIGSQSIGTDTNSFLNSRAEVSTLAKISPAAKKTQFSGRMSQIRFWSKALNQDEFSEHVRNFKSTGVENPLVNFNFNTVSTGAFERLRIDVSTDQILTQSTNAGSIELVDFTQSKFATLPQENKKYDPSKLKMRLGDLYPWYLDGPGASKLRIVPGYYHLTGTGFEGLHSIITPEDYSYSFLSPNFDQKEGSDKVRIRGLIPPFNRRENPYALPSPVHELPSGEKPDDDPRFSIEFSCVQALSEDMMQLLSSLEFFDNSLGDTNLMFSEGYPDLESMREIYFNRLTEKVNFVKFFEFFKWFDMGFTSLIEQMIPRKARFIGVQFIIESHVYERHKLMYHGDDIYLSENERGVPNVTPSGGMGLALPEPFDGTVE